MGQSTWGVTFFQPNKLEATKFKMTLAEITAQEIEEELELVPTPDAKRRRKAKRGKKARKARKSKKGKKKAAKKSRKARKSKNLRRPRRPRNLRRPRRPRSLRSPRSFAEASERLSRR